MKQYPQGIRLKHCFNCRYEVATQRDRVLQLFAKPRTSLAPHGDQCATSKT